MSNPGAEANSALATQRADRAVYLNKRGQTTKQIARVLGIDRRTVSRYLSERGVGQPPNIPLSGDELARAFLMLEDGYNYYEVARTLGRAPRTIVKKFPGYAITKQEAGRLSRATKVLREH